jgi:hypothetical protein
MIRRETPEVITGARGPREARALQADEQKAKRDSGLRKQPDGKVRFQSRYANYRIQLTAPPDLRDPFTGRLTPGRPKAAQFREHEYDVEANDTEKIGWLKSHPQFGKTFWLYSDIVEESKRRDVENAKRILEDPEQRAAVLEALKESGVTDFVLPTIEENA